MKRAFYIVSLFVAFAISMPLEAKKIGEISLFSNLRADSVVATIMPEGVFFANSIQRHDFDVRKVYSSEITIRDSLQIAAVIDSLKNCDVVSPLPHPTNVVVKKMKVVRNKKNKYWTFWFDDDKIDSHCRLFIYRKNDVLVAWMSNTGEFDFGMVKCDGGKGVLKLIRNMINCKK